MFSQFEPQTRQMLTGNLLLIGCCIFYIAWWLIAFHPTHAIKGFKSGWLLIPAAIFGLWAVVEIVRGSTSVRGLFSPTWIVVVGVIIYIALLALTMLLLKRQVTTELFLIVGWGVIMFMELSALYAQQQFTRTAAITWMVVVVIAAAVSMVCYLLYYNLDSVKGYVDGLVPLALVAVMMAAVTIGVEI